MGYDLSINGERMRVDVEPDTPLLWVLTRRTQIDRHKIRMRLCAVRRLYCACRRRAGPIVPDDFRRRRDHENRHDRGGSSASRLRPCAPPGVNSTCRYGGYCQSGQIMSAAALLAGKCLAERRRHRRCDGRHPASCATYHRIPVGAGIHRAAEINEGMERHDHSAFAPYFPHQDRSRNRSSGLVIGLDLPFASAKAVESFAPNPFVRVSTRQHRHRTRQTTLDKGTEGIATGLFHPCRRGARRRLEANARRVRPADASKIQQPPVRLLQVLTGRPLL